MTNFRSDVPSKSGRADTAPGEAKPYHVQAHPRPMPQAPGAVPFIVTEKMLEALHPENLSVSMHPARLAVAAQVFGLETLEPQDAGGYVLALTTKAKSETLARLVRENLGELWTLLDCALLPYPKSALNVARKFPGLIEAFEAAVDRYGPDAINDANARARRDVAARLLEQR